jgi:hypothetical protein
VKGTLELGRGVITAETASSPSTSPVIPARGRALMRWPSRPIPIDPSKLPAATTVIIDVLAEAGIQLAAFWATER